MRYSQLSDYPAEVRAQLVELARERRQLRIARIALVLTAAYVAAEVAWWWWWIK